MASKAGRHFAMQAWGSGGLSATGPTLVELKVARATTVHVMSATLSSGRVAVDVSWGDGDAVTVWGSWDSGSPLSHEYPPGTWILSISDDVFSLSLFGDESDGSCAMKLIQVAPGVRRLGPDGFPYAVSLENPTALTGSGVTTFLDPRSYGYGLFHGCTSLSGDLTWLPSGLCGSVPEGCFRGCTGITSLDGLNCSVPLPAAGVDGDGFVYLYGYGTASGRYTGVNVLTIKYNPVRKKWQLVFSSEEWLDAVLKDTVLKDFDGLTGVGYDVPPLEYDTDDGPVPSSGASYTDSEFGTLRWTFALTIHDNRPFFGRGTYRQTYSFEFSGVSLNGFSVVGASADSVWVRSYSTSGGVALWESKVVTLFASANLGGSADPTDYDSVLVTRIGDYAFAGCSNLATFGSGTFAFLSSIGDAAFRDTAVTRYPEPQMTVYNPHVSPGLPVTRRVGDRAFSGCRKLEYITCERGNRFSFGDRAFEFCTGLKSLDGLSNPTYSCVVTLSGGTKYSTLFAASGSGGSDWTTSGVIYYGEGQPLAPDPTYEVDGKTVTVSFASGQTMTRVFTKAVSSVTVTPLYCLGGTSLSSGQFSGTRNCSVGRGTFAGCTGLTNIRGLPPAVRDYPDELFHGCTGLVEAVDPSDDLGIVDYYDSPSDTWGVAGAPATGWENTYTNAQFVVGVEQHTVLKTIGAFAFADCSGLTSVEFRGVSSVGALAFSGCSALQRLAFVPRTRYGNKVQPWTFAQRFTSALVSVGRHVVFGSEGTPGVEYSAGADEFLAVPWTDYVAWATAGYPEDEIPSSAFTIKGSGTLSAADVLADKYESVNGCVTVVFDSRVFPSVTDTTFALGGKSLPILESSHVAHVYCRTRRTASGELFAPGSSDTAVYHEGIDTEVVCPFIGYTDDIVLYKFTTTTSTVKSVTVYFVPMALPTGSSPSAGNAVHVFLRKGDTIDIPLVIRKTDGKELDGSTLRRGVVGTVTATVLSRHVFQTGTADGSNYLFAYKIKVPLPQKPNGTTYCPYGYQYEIPVAESLTGSPRSYWLEPWLSVFTDDTGDSSDPFGTVVVSDDMSALASRGNPVRCLFGLRGMRSSVGSYAKTFNAVVPIMYVGAEDTGLGTVTISAYGLDAGDSYTVEASTNTAFSGATLTVVRVVSGVRGVYEVKIGDSGPYVAQTINTTPNTYRGLSIKYPVTREAELNLTFDVEDYVTPEVSAAYPLGTGRATDGPQVSVAESSETASDAETSETASDAGSLPTSADKYIVGGVRSNANVLPPYVVHRKRQATPDLVHLIYVYDYSHNYVVFDKIKTGFLKS